MLRNVFTLCLVFSAATVAPADLETARKAFATGDYKTAVAELLPLAEAGNAKAQGNLGWMYRNGVGVTQNHAEAVKWFRKAAGQGHAPGQYNLGLMYEEGFGVKQDYAGPSVSTMAGILLFGLMSRNSGLNCSPSRMLIG